MEKSDGIRIPERFDDPIFLSPIPPITCLGSRNDQIEVKLVYVITGTNIHVEPLTECTFWDNQSSCWLEERISNQPILRSASHYLIFSPVRSWPGYGVYSFTAKSCQRNCCCCDKPHLASCIAILAIILLALKSPI